MNTKKILRYVVCAAAAAAAMGGAASAQVTLNTTSIQEGVVTLSGTADGDFVTYKVYKAGEEPDKDGMAAFGEIKTDASGAFSLAFELGESGTFEAVLYDGSEYKTIELEFADAQSRADFIERLNSVLSDPSAVLALLNDEQNSAVLNTIGVPADTFGAYPAALQSKICERISSDNAGSTLTENTFLSSYREAAACESMNYDASEYAEAVLAEMNFEYEGEKYGDIKDADKKAFVIEAFEKNAPYDTLDEMSGTYKKINILNIVNNTRTVSIASTLKQYADDLGISSEKAYTDYVNKRNSTADRTVVEKLSSAPAMTADALLDILESSVAGSSGSIGGGGTGGGGSSRPSGGGGGGISSPGGTVPGIITGGGTNNNNPGEDPGEGEEQPAAFSDVSEGHWAYAQIMSLKNSGIINGYDDGTFRPDASVTREEFVKMIVAALGLDTENASSHFYDVFDSDWFYPYLSAAFENGIVTGDNNGLFGVKANITRQDAVVIAYRSIMLKGAEIEQQREYQSFTDEGSISDYAKDAVRSMFCGGKINGMPDGSFAPFASCTRAEAAIIIGSVL